MIAIDMTQWVHKYLHKMLDKFDETLHGAMIALLIDVCGSLVVALRGGLNYSSGVSTDMNILFTNPARKGDVLIINAECIKF
ncbi:23754_t:CDS:2, partial [Dentiscutata erythropus]